MTDDKPYGSPTGFVAFEQYLNANQDGADQMAAKGAASASATTNPHDLQRNAGLAQSAAGQQAFIQKAYGKGASVSPLDAALAGNAQGGYFQALQQMYGQAGNKADAHQKALADSRRRTANAPQKPPTTAGDVYNQQQAALKSQADAFRAEDAKRPAGQMGRERWANLHGMTLEQWISAGMQPAF